MIEEHCASEAFGHSSHAYQNVGHLSQIQVKLEFVQKKCCMHSAVYVQFVDDIASSLKLSTGSLQVACCAEGVDCVHEWLPFMVLFV